MKFILINIDMQVNSQNKYIYNIVAYDYGMAIEKSYGYTEDSNIAIHYLSRIALRIFSHSSSCKENIYLFDDYYDQLVKLLLSEYNENKHSEKYESKYILPKSSNQHNGLNIEIKISNGNMKLEGYGKNVIALFQSEKINENLYIINENYDYDGKY